MIEITTSSNYYLVFTRKNMDGLFSAFAVKCAYDNNLYNDLWDMNVKTIFCDPEYDNSFEWFKDNILTYLNNIKSIDSKASVTVMMLGFCPAEHNAILKIYNLCTAYECSMLWIDNNLDDITDYKHLNIPGKQAISKDSCAVDVFWYLKNNVSDEWLIDCNDLPRIFDYESAICTKSGRYSKEDLLDPIVFFLDALDFDINNNKSDIVEFLKSSVQQPNLIEHKYVVIGSFIRKYHNIHFKETIEPTMVNERPDEGQPVEENMAQVDNPEKIVAEEKTEK